MKKHHLHKFIPAFIWMIVIFYFSSFPTSGVVGTSTQRFLILKSFHLIEYAILAIFIYFAINHFRLSLLISYLYALSDELHQFFTPGRTSKFTDTLIDLVGIIIGFLIYDQIIKRLFKKI